MVNFFSTTLSFQRIVDLLVWGVSCVALVFGFYNITVLNNAFVFWCTIAYIIGLFSILPLFRSDAVLRRYGYRRLAAIIELLLTLSLVFNGIGSLGFYVTTVHYDDFVHLLTPATVTWGFGIWITARIALRDQIVALPRQVWKVVIIGLALAFVWEPVEFLTDMLLGTNTFGQDGQQFDTYYDLIMGVLGVCVGWIVFVYTRVRVLRWIQRGE